MNQIYVCSSYFHVFVSILKLLEQRHIQSKSLIIISDHIPDMINLIPRLKEAGYFDHHIVVPFVFARRELRKRLSFLASIINRNENTVNAVESVSDIKAYHNFIENAEINIFNNRGFAYNYFLLKYPSSYIRLIEDGMGNYYKLVTNFQAFKRRKILNTVIGAGYDDEVNEIQVKFPEQIDEKLQRKASKLLLDRLQANITDQNREKILRIFMNNVGINLLGNRKLLLITQPLSEDKLLHEMQKIKLYNSILDPYGKNFTIFLKPHPREITDYKNKLHYPFIEIPRGFPLEMFNLLEGLQFEIGLTVFSSAINNVTCIDKKISLGKEYLKTL